MGRLEVEKGHSILIDALAELHRRGLPLKLEIVGDGSRRPHLERRVRKLGLDSSVSFAGPIGQDELPDRYKAADIFCVPSLGEGGGPVVAMEAMSLGLPVVASNTMGIPELIEDGVTGLLSPPGLSGELADQIERLARGVALRRRLGVAGRERVAEGFDRETWIEELCRCFEEFVEPDAGSSGQAADATEAPLNMDGESSRASRPLVSRHE